MVFGFKKIFQTPPPSWRIPRRQSPLILVPYRIVPEGRITRYRFLTKHIRQRINLRKPRNHRIIEPRIEIILLRGRLPLIAIVKIVGFNTFFCRSRKKGGILTVVFQQGKIKKIVPKGVRGLEFTLIQ
jgi:hypothetical protein